MNPKHSANIEKANLHIQKLRKINDPRLQFWYLRNKVSAYEFEEMILSLLDEAGYVIKRNSKYSGDHGCDGMFLLNGRGVLIQSKAYTNYISPSDVIDHSNLCKRLNRKGIFIHSGKTGKLSKKVKSRQIDIISGERLLRLINMGQVDFLFKTGSIIELYLHIKNQIMRFLK